MAAVVPTGSHGGRAATPSMPNRTLARTVDGDLVVHPARTKAAAPLVTCPTRPARRSASESSESSLLAMHVGSGPQRCRSLPETWRACPSRSRTTTTPRHPLATRHTGPRSRRSQRRRSLPVAPCVVPVASAGSMPPSTLPSSSRSPTPSRSAGPCWPARQPPLSSISVRRSRPPSPRMAHVSPTFFQVP